MGFLSALGKIAGIGGAIAAPFTGGASLALTGLSTAGKVGKALGAVGDVSSILGAQEGGKAQGKVTQAQLQQQQDRTALDRYRSMQDAEFSARDQDLKTKAFETQNRGTVAKQGLIAALLAGKMDPTSITNGKASGGLLAALKANPEAQGAAQRMMEQAGQASINPLQFKGGNMLSAPGLTPLPQVDKGGFLSALARIGQLAGATSGAFKGSGDPGPSAGTGDTFSQPQLAGVAPFTLPPKAKLLTPEDEYDWSNR